MRAEEVELMFENCLLLTIHRLNRLPRNCSIPIFEHIQPFLGEISNFTDEMS